MEVTTNMYNVEELIWIIALVLKGAEYLEGFVARQDTVAPSSESGGVRNISSASNACR